MELTTILSRSEYFKGLSDQSRLMVARMCRRRLLERRETLFFEGGQGKAVYLLGEGSVQLTKSSPDGREIVIRTVMSGDMFGEVILFERDTYPVTATALQNSSLYELPRTEMLTLLRDETFRRDFISSLLRRMRYLTDRILSLSLQDVDDRFFAFLETRYGRHQDYTLDMAKKDVAAAIATTPETFSRMIQRLRRSKILTLQGKQLKLKVGFWQGR